MGKDASVVDRDRRTVRLLREGDLTIREIAAVVGMSKSWVGLYAKRHGIDRKPPKSKTRSASIKKAWVARKKAGWTSPMKGKKYPPEVRARMGSKKGQPARRRGPRSAAERKRISEGTRRNALRGKECPAYKDGKLAERRGLRFSRQAKRWRYDVFLRDAFTCQDCGDDRGGNLQAHHIKAWADYPDLRFDIENGITLCRSCHKKRHLTDG